MSIRLKTLSSHVEVFSDALLLYARGISKKKIGTEKAKLDSIVSRHNITFGILRKL